MQERKLQRNDGKGQVRVLQVLDFINHNSGVSAVVMNYFIHMDPKRVRCDFLLYEDAEEDLRVKLKGRGAEIFVTGQPSGRAIAAYRRKIDEFFAQHGGEYDIVHVHIPNAAFAVLGSAKKYGIPVRILHSHNAKGADGTGKRIRNFCLNKWGICYANQYFACSAAAGKYLFGEKKSTAGQVEILNNAIDLRRYAYSLRDRTEIRKKLGVEGEFLLGHVGRFAEQKNHTELLDIFAEFQKYGVDSKLVLLGDGELLEEIRKKAAVLGVEEKVVFAGVVSDVEKYLSAMDVFLLPSLYEGLPVVCVEAQAAGLPCLVSENVTREIKLTEEVFFLENGDRKQWCRTLLKVSKESCRRGPMAGMDAYDIENAAKKLEEKYLAYGTGANTDVHV